LARFFYAFFLIFIPLKSTKIYIMDQYSKSNNGFSRRKFIGSAAAIAAGISVSPHVLADSLNGSGKPDSRFKGVQIGAITYSWRSMPSTAQDILNYCVESGISSIELMGNVAEEYAGIPPLPPRPARDASETERAAYQRDADMAKETQREWRLSASMNKYQELRKLFNKAGINIHIVKFAPANWTSEEIDYAFNAAKVLGAKGITNEIGHEACARLGKFAEKHNMYAIYHNHAQPGEPGFSFDEFLDYSPRNMLNFDVGHYFGATGKHPNEVIERLHSRIFSIHLKDKTGKDASPANTNMPWGEGDTPIDEILKLIQKNKWPIYCDIELEYPVPESSNAQKEIIKCVEYCRNILV
jgi:sugar phosphate isomerase/epimerase